MENEYNDMVIHYQTLRENRTNLNNELLGLQADIQAKEQTLRRRKVEKMIAKLESLLEQHNVPSLAAATRTATKFAVTETKELSAELKRAQKVYGTFFPL